MRWVLYRLAEKLFSGKRADGQPSYSQCGEDRIVKFIFDTLRIPAPCYLDIGAHHPYYLNNTALFYMAGGRGVNIEPDPALITSFYKNRPRDANLNIGISDKDGRLDFFVMNVRTLNTFSEIEARQLEQSGKFRIEKVLQIPVRSINAVIEDQFGNSSPDFVSLDVEGLDLKILQSFDFSRWKPKVICVETITYSDQREGQKISEIAALLHGNGYFTFADTHINTIFVDCEVWHHAH